MLHPTSVFLGTEPLLSQKPVEDSQELHPNPLSPETRTRFLFLALALCAQLLGATGCSSVAFYAPWSSAITDTRGVGQIGFQQTTTSISFV